MDAIGRLLRKVSSTSYRVPILLGRATFSFKGDKHDSLMRSVLLACSLILLMSKHMCAESLCSLFAFLSPTLMCPSLPPGTHLRLQIRSMLKSGREDRTRRPILTYPSVQLVNYLRKPVLIDNKIPAGNYPMTETC